MTRTLLKEELEEKGYDRFRKILNTLEKPLKYNLVAWSSTIKRMILKSEDKSEYYAIMKLFIKLLNKKK